MQCLSLPGVEGPVRPRPHLCPLLGSGRQPLLLPIPTLGLAFSSPPPPEIYGGAAVKNFFRTFSICCSGGRCERSPPSPAPHAAGESRRRACVRPPRPLAPSTRRDCGRGRKERGGGPDQLGGADGEPSRPKGEEARSGRGGRGTGPKTTCRTAPSVVQLEPTPDAVAAAASERVEVEVAGGRRATARNTCTSNEEHC